MKLEFCVNLMHNLPLDQILQDDSGHVFCNKYK